MSKDNEITINLLLLGRTQSGKSAVGNSLLGSIEFDSHLSARSVTQVCRSCRCRMQNFGRRLGKELCLQVHVVDTPGFPHSSLGKKAVARTIREALVQHFQEGLHMALLVLRADLPLCEEERCHIVQLAENLLGSDWKRFTAIIFSHGDKVREAGFKEEEYLQTASEALIALLDSVHHRYLFKDFQENSLPQERTIIMNKIMNFVRQNGYEVLKFE
ncbi:GTPase IMAP family member GIMD1 [Microcaecilia unicolor]|uniref:GTPase IMAP family member GIMD1 n=1 Tax=Microcaecilia unicolor TaxID=1415580 RepID=A0A6P7WYQ3_9AMPH|nr:GTPase IMAP family member GIMD1 [Microcaecilia unicolor]